MKKRRRIASIEAAIAKLGMTKAETKVLDAITGPAPPALDNGFRPLWPAAPPPPLVTPPRCTSTPPCGRCYYCRVFRDGPDWWHWPPVPMGRSGVRRGRP